MRIPHTIRNHELFISVIYATKFLFRLRVNFCILLNFEMWSFVVKQHLNDEESGLDDTI